MTVYTAFVTENPGTGLETYIHVPGEFDTSQEALEAGRLIGTCVSVFDEWGQVRVLEPSELMRYAFPAIVAAGYEQLECNDEGLTDFDDACRIAAERGAVLPTMGSPSYRGFEQLFKKEFETYRKTPNV